MAALAQPAASPPANPAPNPKWMADLAVRPGLAVSIAVDNVLNARALETDGATRLFISRPTSPVEAGKRSEHGDILCLRDKDGDGLYETRTTFVTGPLYIHGLCWQPEPGAAPGTGWLWYSTSGSVHRARDKDGDGRADEDVEVLKEGSLPSGGAQWWHSVLVTGDRLYTSIGDSANATDEATTDRQKIWSFALDGSARHLFASGLRSTQKLRVRPGTAEIWGLDDSSDHFGRPLGEEPGAQGKGQPISDDNPPEELNKYTDGGFYGHPYLAGTRVPRYEYMNKSDLIQLAATSTNPELCFPAHWAGSGFTFLDPAVVHRTAGRGGGMPASMAGDMIACFHGSWSRTEPAGHCVARVIFDPVEKRPIGYVKLVDGLKPLGDHKWQPLIRPVDAVQALDGSILFSCDMTGRVYRIRAKPEEPPG